MKQRTEELHKTNELLRKTNAELERISMIDELTEISNRRGFDVTFQKSWGISMRERQPLALIMIDIDNFKVFNDTYGHLAGDQCLKSVAQEINKAVKRTGDLVARFGGEEFLVMLLNTTEEEATIVAEDIRKKIEKLRFAAGDPAITISLGVAAVIPNDSVSADDLINAADKALYKAKKNGRNNVVNISSLENINFDG